ncbi:MULTISPECIES: RES family NAD+ phosphorylase [unclassified Pseudomonas]|uniref:RES family NAD+ phosphorylase n=1 Tax=unclassified Pseudomonas TaxID=196821 RepID=UPI00257FB31A|nr:MULTISPECIES: RES family NAD+ phosphorylase [unclassified Pseudomonas]
MAKSPRLPIAGQVLNLSFTTLPAGTLLHRIHSNRYGPAQYNLSGMGNARFSPIRDATGQVIPTLYAGTTFHCAAMETLFHDIPYAPGFKAVQQRRYAGNLHSQVVPGRDLQLVDLSSKALRLLGVPRSQLIDTEAERYPYTRQWAEAIHAFAPQAHGLRWISRQDDEALAIVLFGDRLADADLQSLAPSRDVLNDPAAFADLLDLAERIGVLLLPDAD